MGPGERAGLGWSSLLPALLIAGSLTRRPLALPQTKVQDILKAKVRRPGGGGPGRIC